MRRSLLCLVLLSSCAAPVVRHTAGAPADPAAEPPSGAVRLLFAGDVMLGRGVAEYPEAEDLLADVRPPVASADLAVANLESPLTSRPHDPASGPNALEADPTSAALLASAGFDALSVANNHAGDAGPVTVSDTTAALATAGLDAVGGGTSAAEAFSPVVVDVGGVRVALFAFDATGQGPRAGAEGPGIAWWDETLVHEALTRARASADVIAVGIHGGTEYVPTTDPYVMRLARQLAGWGADVVWGSGPHVVQPVRTIDPDDDDRVTVVATSLGNLLFDQHLPGTRRGALLEVLVGSDGVRAFRVGSTQQPGTPVGFRGWLVPRDDAAFLTGSWWAVVGAVDPLQRRNPASLEDLEGDVVDSALGDVDGDGRLDLVVAFRRPYRPTEVNALIPARRLVDALGRTAHVGLYRPRDLRPRWVAGTLLRPVAALAPCDGALAVAYSTLNDPTVVATGAWRWGGFGFVPLPDLPGAGTPACADVDGDGLLDPLVLERSL